ncbi:MAG TPA: hypothetical protein VGM06_17480 [Polyangiaceae bacterium]|jgi:hypothetical protein
MARSARADALVRAILSLGDSSLRASYVASIGRSWDMTVFAHTLDVICERAEQAEASTREALLAVVDALNAEGMEEVVQRLREQAAGESLLALERLVRMPVRSSAPPPRPAERVREGRDGAMTLGQRKSLARRPNRDTIARVLGDSHPDVIRRVLRNPRVTEDDVVRVAARRPSYAAVLAELARSTKWSHRPRVRMALVMNPSTPPEIAARIAGLLLRPELELVARSPAVPPSVRAVCFEHLARRPPVDHAGRGGQGGRIH